MHILHREWKAVKTIPRAELTLEVHGPDRVGVHGFGRRPAGMPASHTAPPLRNEAVAVQDVMNSGEGGQLQLGSVALQVPRDLLRTVIRVPSADLQNRLDHVSGRCQGRSAGSGGAVLKALRSAVEPALDPLVAGLAADAVAPAER
jgi:hypothetical protein